MMIHHAPDVSEIKATAFYFSRPRGSTSDDYRDRHVYNLRYAAAQLDKLPEEFWEQLEKAPDRLGIRGQIIFWGKAINERPHVFERQADGYILSAENGRFTSDNAEQCRSILGAYIHLRDHFEVKGYPSGVSSRF